MLQTILIVIMVLALLGGLPHWPYSTEWGYGPSSTIGVLLVIMLIVLMLRGP